MFDLISRPAHETIPGSLTPSVAPAYRGPERRHAANSPWRWLSAALDEIDYGMLLIDQNGHPLHVNQLARGELDAEHPLQLIGQELRARLARDVTTLNAALHGALRRGLRKLLTLGEGPQQVSVSVVPLGAPAGDGAGQAALVTLGKRQVGGELAVQGFARIHHLTPGETRVLTALCRGAPPAEIAAEYGVKICTVRTQIGCIRVKTGAPSIRALVRQVAVLPPLLGVLRHAAPDTPRPELRLQG